jgi:hypothetical protein
MDYFSKRLPHVLTRKDLVILLTPTYATALRVDEEIAEDRIERALESPNLLDELYSGISAALGEQKGPRTTEDALIDKLSAGVEKRRARVKPASVTPAISAVLVRIDLEAGIAAEMMRTTLDTDRGRALLREGLRALGAHLVKELVR